MEEKFIRKVEKLLEKGGLGEEEIAKIIEIAKSESTKEVEPTDEPKGEELPNEEPKGEEPVEEQPKVEVEVEAEAPKEDAPVEQPLPPEVVEEAPIEEAVPQVNDELLSKVDELQKANEGLVERLNALEEALRKSKVLTDEAGVVGIDQNNAPANEPIDDPWGSVLAEINHRR